MGVLLPCAAACSPAAAEHAADRPARRIVEAGRSRRDDVRGGAVYPHREEHDGDDRQQTVGERHSGIDRGTAADQWEQSFLFGGASWLRENEPT